MSDIVVIKRDVVTFDIGCDYTNCSNKSDSINDLNGNEVNLCEHHGELLNFMKWIEEIYSDKH